MAQLTINKRYLVPEGTTQAQQDAILTGWDIVGRRRTCQLILDCEFRAQDLEADAYVPLRIAFTLDDISKAFAQELITAESALKVLTKTAIAGSIGVELLFFDGITLYSTAKTEVILGILSQEEQSTKKPKDLAVFLVDAGADVDRICLSDSTSYRPRELEIGPTTIDWEEDHCFHPYENKHDQSRVICLSSMHGITEANAETAGFKRRLIRDTNAHFDRWLQKRHRQQPWSPVPSPTETCLIRHAPPAHVWEMAVANVLELHHIQDIYNAGLMSAERLQAIGL